jgi:hypothetical protein
LPLRGQRSEEQKVRGQEGKKVRKRGQEIGNRKEERK